MIARWNSPRHAVSALMLAGLAAIAAVPASAQDDGRLRKVEAEVKALQRAVFPGDGRFFTPEVTPGTPPGTPQGQVQTPVGVPSATALSAVLARLDSLEAQVAQLTAHGEESDNALAQLKARFDATQPAAATPAPSAQPTGIIPLPALNTPAPTPARAVSRPTPTPGSTLTPAATALRPAVTPAAATTSVATGPTAARLTAVRAIAKPATADAGDDEYSYGYRLWEAGFFPEARQQLALYLQKYPRHERVSYARNLLGRAYMDDAQPREAAKYFFDNYQADKQGARAADSLLFLSETMIAINDTNRACIALAEFGDTYPALATGRLKEQYDRTRNKVRCT